MELKHEEIFKCFSTNGMEESKKFSFIQFYSINFEKLPVHVSLSVKRPNLSELDEHPWISTHDVLTFIFKKMFLGRTLSLCVYTHVYNL